MKSELATYLLADTNISGVVGDKIYSFPIPEGISLPYILLSRITQKEGGFLTSRDNRQVQTWQIDVYSDRDIEAENIKDLVIDRLNIHNTFDMAGIAVLNSFLITSRDLSNIQQQGSQEANCRKQIEFIIINKIS